MRKGTRHEPVVGMYADEMGVGPSGNKKKRFSWNLPVSRQKEEVIWLEEATKAMAVTHSGGSVCTEDILSF